MTLGEAILNPATRIKAVGQLHDWMRMNGCQYSRVVASVQEVFTKAGQVAPEAAEVDKWLSESEGRDDERA